MINYVFGGIVLLSVLCGIFLGNGGKLTESIISSSKESIELLLIMAGSMMLWSGIMEVASCGGVTKFVGKVLSPVLRKIFKNVPKGSVALDKISLNVSANLFGLGNAATPFGLSAMQELKRLDNNGEKATDDMIAFVVLNTASIQILPTMIATLRESYGSNEPFSILPCIWITSVCSLIVGQFMVKILNRKKPINI